MILPNYDETYRPKLHKHIDIIGKQHLMPGLADAIVTLLQLELERAGPPQWYKWPIEMEISLPTRTYNALRKTDIRYIKDIIPLSLSDLVAIKGLSKQSATQLYLDVRTYIEDKQQEGNY